ncbi:hypothetical protein BDZ94DRAFT_1262749 [Collybia nuda]|uniref:Uncharacterized protein n=1 Tax=Collybia nuda TaxID=64659 RepID=A0A9P5Y1S8_9AGAR|nr:hypothetical protein BDZ94DRAFT_1262749 [Collybia nuda]
MTSSPRLLSPRYFALVIVLGDAQHPSLIVTIAYTFLRCFHNTASLPYRVIRLLGRHIA